jgi:hypothetical protein
VRFISVPHVVFLWACRYLETMWLVGLCHWSTEDQVLRTFRRYNDGAKQIWPRWLIGNILPQLGAFPETDRFNDRGVQGPSSNWDLIIFNSTCEHFVGRSYEPVFRQAFRFRGILINREIVTDCHVCVAAEGCLCLCLEPAYLDS